VALPTDSGERTLVSDGTTRWAWNSDDHTVVKRPAGAQPDRTAPTDPAAAATQALADLRATSTVAVDGTATVAGRGAYELVLTPAPTERTLLREVRVAVDAEKRIPLRLTVLATGSSGPALQIGFTDLSVRPAGSHALHIHPTARRHGHGRTREGSGHAARGQHDRR
jgi:outer membrane lipoprotein-sorting protein